jgi:hypothetical protein
VTKHVRLTHGKPPKVRVADQTSATMSIVEPSQRALWIAVSGEEEGFESRGDLSVELLHESVMGSGIARRRRPRVDRARRQS